jgi:putative intracellular protease/amidase
MRILMILIPENNASAAKSDPAVRLERAVGPYYVFRDADVEVVLTSPNGGSPLIEFAGDSNASTEATQRFRQDSQQGRARAPTQTSQARARPGQGGQETH